jgi:hypothetical protein
MRLIASLPNSSSDLWNISCIVHDLNNIGAKLVNNQQIITFLKKKTPCDLAFFHLQNWAIFPTKILYNQKYLLSSQAEKLIR